MTHDDSRTRWILGLASVASLMVALDTLVVSTALSTIRVDLGASLDQLEWTVNAYNLSLAVLLITAAGLGDRFGRRRLFAVGLGLFVAASAACGLSRSVGELIAARTVQGAGAALVLTLALTLVSAAFPPERRGAAIGILQGVVGVAVACGPLVGGAIAEGLAWEWIFWVNVPLGLITIPLVRTRMDESHGPDAALDLAGLVLVTGGALGIVWGLVRGNIAGWTSAEVLGALAGGVLLSVAFVAWELRARQPMLPMRFFRSRAFSAGNGAVFLTFAGLFGAVFFFAQFLQTGLGYGPLGAGVRLLPWTATLFLVAPVAGMLVDRFGERPFMSGGLLLQGIGMLWVAAIAGTDLSYPALVPALIMAGVGTSMAIPAAQASVVSSVPPEAVGKAAGTNSMARELGGVFGIAVLVAVFAAAGSYASPVAFVDGFTPAIAAGAGLSLLGALVGLGLPGRRRPSRQAEPAPAEPALQAPTGLAAR